MVCWRRGRKERAAFATDLPAVLDFSSALYRLNPSCIQWTSHVILVESTGDEQGDYQKRWHTQDEIAAAAFNSIQSASPPPQTTNTLSHTTQELLLAA